MESDDDVEAVGLAMVFWDFVYFFSITKKIDVNEMHIITYVKDSFKKTLRHFHSVHALYASLSEVSAIFQMLQHAA